MFLSIASVNYDLLLVENRLHCMDVDFVNK